MTVDQDAVYQAETKVVILSLSWLTLWLKSIAVEKDKFTTTNLLHLAVM